MNGDHGETTVSRNRCVVACLGLVALFALTACTGDSGSTPPTTNVPVTSSPAPTVPVPTPPVQEKTRDSAEAFAVYFWDLYNYGYATYDYKPVQTISDPSCHYCAGLAENLKSIADDGAKTTGYDVKVIDVYTPPSKIDETAFVVTDIEQKPGQVIEASGETTKDPGWKVLQVSFALRWDDTRWVVAGAEAATDKGEPWKG